MERVSLNGVKVYPFTSTDELLAYVSQRKGILVAINAEKILQEKILHATDQTRAIINRNIGYCDGIGAVMAMRKHGYPVDSLELGEDLIAFWLEQRLIDKITYTRLMRHEL